MPKKRPATSGYARIAQADEDEESQQHSEDEDQHQQSLSSSGYAPIQPGRVPRMQGPPSGSRTPQYGRGKFGRRRSRANSGVDIKAINARLEKWADEIASKLKIRKIKGKSAEEEQLEIHYSVFQPPEGMRPATTETLSSEFIDHPEEKLSKMQFDDTVESIRVAIEEGVHPKMISQGSSGSYFARNAEGKVVGVFKPKDEEPYASRNPKWTKWIHRNLFPFFFGRACLIPNLSYISEAAAFVLDSRLQTNIVPYTDVVFFSSPAFYYDIWERRNYYRRKKPLPQKVGSLQVFLRGYKDATIFLKQHPWPDQHTTSRPQSTHSKKKSWTDHCRPGSSQVEEEEEYESTDPDGGEPQQRRTFWTEPLQQSFREELEKLVILDYIMRNTDRGLDNWMIRIDEESQKASIIAEPPKEDDIENPFADSQPYPREQQMTMDGAAAKSPSPKPKVMLGAIDNSLSWPWKHPDAWRSFPFGWLFLPVSLIGKPFSQKTRDHFLPLLTSKQWWSETQMALRRIFSEDSDFQEKMFARQIAIVKGQAWNVVETLKTPEHGPLELTRRARVQVWDDIVEIPTVVPMRQPSDEMRRRRQEELAREAREQEEMDISAARSPVPQSTNDFFGIGLPPNLPDPNRFSLSNRNSEDAGTKSPGSTGIVNGHTPSSLPKARPAPNPSRIRMSFDEPRAFRRSHRERKRNFSFTARGADQETEDDGDLGYSAAREMEGNRKKVIVERLETVRSKNPVFTWC